MTGSVTRDRLLGGLLGTVLVAVAILVATTVGRDGATDALTLDGGAQTVRVHLKDMRISPSRITVPSGTRLTLEVVNDDQMTHDLLVEGHGQTPMLRHGQSARLEIGAVTEGLQGWCTVPGHKAAGMTMSIEVASTGSHDHAAMPGMGSTGTGSHDSGTDADASPGPDWKPYDPTLPAAPPSGTVHRLTFTVRDTEIEVAPGVTQTLWTYNGTAPGPILHGHVGDRFVVTLVNDTDMAHSIDFHAGMVSPDEPMRSLDPGQSLTYEFTADHSGAWLYHCATMPMSLHIANGMYGAVIIDPPGLAPVAKELVLVQSELYLGPDGGTADEDKINARTPDHVVFNGYVNQYAYSPIAVGVGERVRVWVVDAGPQFDTSFHVVGTQFDTVFKEGAYLLRPGNAEQGAAQTLGLEPAQGGFVEFTLPAAGHYPFLDHAMVDGESGASGVFVAS